MTSQTFFLIFIPTLAIILLAVKFATLVVSFFKVNADKFYITAACFLTVSLPMRQLLTSLGMEILIPV